MNDELQQVSRRLSGLTQRRPGLALGLWGEPGIGKTHLARTLLRAFPGRSWTVHATQTLSSVASTLPKPRNVPLWLERSLERLAHGAQADEGVGVQTLLALLTATAPVVLHVEDLHEASAEGLAFWSQVAEVVRRTRSVGLLVTGRAVPPAGVEALKLYPLSREASDALLEAEAGAALPTEALAWVFERARGNPLYTLEFFRHLTRKGFAWNDGHRWRWRMPELEVMPKTVEAVIEQQLLKVGGALPVRQTLEATALLPLGSPASLLAAVASLEDTELQAAQQLLTRQGIFAGTEFAHPLFREVQLATMRPEQRREVARRALKALEHAPLEAADFVGSAALGDAQSLAILRQAAARAREAANPSLEGQLLARAARYAGGDEQYRTALGAAQLLKRLDLTTAAQMGELALSIRAHDTAAIDELADIFASQNQRDRLEQVLAQLPGEEEHERLLRRLRLAFALGDDAGVIELAEQHPAVVRRDPHRVIDLVWSLFELGRRGEAEALIAQTLDRSDLSEANRANLAYLHAAVLSHSGDHHAAELVIQQALEAFRRLGHGVNIVSALNAHALVLQQLGRYQEVLPKFEEVARWCIELGSLKLLAQVQLSIGDQLRWFGQYERAEQLYGESLEILHTFQVTDYLIDGLRSVAELYCTWDVPYGAALASKYAAEAIEVARAAQTPVRLVKALSAQVRASLHHRQPAQALASAEEVLRLEMGMGRPDQRSHAHHLMALALDAAGRKGEAQGHAREALRWAAESDDAFATRIVNVELARLTGDVALALELLNWFKERALLDGVRLVQRAFPELGQAPSGSAPPGVPLRLEVLGPMQLRQGDVSTVLRGGKRKELLALLLEARIRGRSEVTALTLSDALYPLEPEEAALGALRATIFKIRSSLSSTLITTTTNGYALGPVASDVEAFLHSGDTHLWRGMYLENVPLESRDEYVCDSLNTALVSRVRALIEADTPTDLAEAVRLSHLLVRTEPYDLTTLALACRAVQASRNRKALDRLYAEARTRMLEVGEVLPEDSVAFLEKVSDDQFQKT